ncbi:MAG: Ig-like domain repeat protein [Methanobacteriaceae archaeon]|nr:Ig-like domain repeat protein [Methanobacteriaceae archaeon]
MTMINIKKLFIFVLLSLLLIAGLSAIDAANSDNHSIYDSTINKINTEQNTQIGLQDNIDKKITGNMNEQVKTVSAEISENTKKVSAKQTGNTQLSNHETQNLESTKNCDEIDDNSFEISENKQVISLKNGNNLINFLEDNNHVNVAETAYGMSLKNESMDEADFVLSEKVQKISLKNEIIYEETKFNLSTSEDKKSSEKESVNSDSEEINNVSLKNESMAVNMSLDNTNDIIIKESTGINNVNVSELSENKQSASLKTVTLNNVTVNDTVSLKSVTNIYENNTIYVSPLGNGSGNSTDNPTTLNKAITNIAKNGNWTINVAGGVYNFTRSLTIGTNNNAVNITINGDVNEQVIFDGLNKSKMFYLSNKGTTLTVNNLNFINGASGITPYGGAIFCRNGNLNVNNCNFTNNKINIPSGSGGAIAFYDDNTNTNTLNITNCNFINNYGARFGGALRIWYENSTNSGRGGYMENITVFIDNCNFINNSVNSERDENGNSGSRGGAINIHAIKSNITNCNFTENYARDCGGAIRTDSVLYLENCIFDKNSIGETDKIHGDGIAIYNNNGENGIYDSDLYLINCTFENHATNTGRGTIFNMGDANIIVYGECKFINNSAVNGGIFYNDGGNIKIDHGVNYFENNFATNNGGVIYNNGGIMNISEVIVKNNFATNNGGFIYNNGGSIYINNNSNIKNNKATNGAVLYNNAKSKSIMKIEDSLFENNSASENGGVMEIIGVSELSFNALEIENAKFINNNANKGGVIYTQASINIISSEFENNIASEGGVIYNLLPLKTQDGDVKVVATDSIFKYNKATNGNGGVIYNNGIINIDNNQFIDNFATNNGGVIYNNGGIMNISEVIVKNNFATNNGGFIYNNGGSIYINNNSNIKNNKATNGAVLYNNAKSKSIMKIEDSLFENNSASENGGVMEIIGVSELSFNALEIENAKFINNNANKGGVIYTQASINIISSEFENNIASEGGVIYNLLPLKTQDGDVKVVATDSIFKYNKATNGNGGVIYNNGIINIDNNQFIDNFASENGGAIFNYGNEATKTDFVFVNNNAFINNIATNGGALYLKNSTKVSMNNTLFKNNNATNKGGAIYTEGTKYLTITNSSLQNNKAKVGGAINSENTLVNITYSIIYNNTADGTCTGITADSSSTAYYNWWGTNSLSDDKIEGISAKYPVILEINGKLNIDQEETNFLVSLNKYLDDDGQLKSLPENGNFPSELVYLTTDMNGLFVSTNTNIDLLTTVNGQYNGKITSKCIVYATLNNQTVSLQAPEGIIINVQDITTNYNQEIIIPVEITCDYGIVNEGNIVITINGKGYKANVINGIANITYTGFDNVNTYNMDVEYINSSNNYNYKSSNATLTITPNNVEVLVNDIVLDYNKIEDILVTVKGNDSTLLNGTVTITINGKDYSANVINGKAIVSYDGFDDVNVYLMDVEFVSDSKNYNSGITTATLTINKINTVVSVSDVTVLYGESVKIPVNVNNALNGTVTITINGKDYSASVTNGKAIVSYDGNDNVNNYDLKVKFTSASENYENKLIVKTITILPLDTTVSVSDVNVKYLNNVDITVNVIANNIPLNQGTVTITINGIEYTTKVTNGKAVINYYAKDDVGSYKIYVNYISASDNYKSGTTNADLTISKLDTIIEVDNPVITEKTTELNVSVKDEHGNPINDSEITIVINENEKKVAVKDGVAIIQTDDLNVTDDSDIIIISEETTNNKKGEITEKIIVIGDVNITVNDVKAIIGDNVTFNANVTYNSGSNILEGTVVFKLNENTIGKALINNGKATLTFNIPDDWTAKDYIITAVYVNNSRRSVAKGILTLGKITTNIETYDIKTVSGTEVKFLAKVTDSNGNLMTTGKVIFKINGREIGSTSVSEGLASYTFSIPDWSAKDYTITAVYGANNLYERSEANAGLILTKTFAVVNVFNVSALPGTNINLTATVTTPEGNLISEGQVIIKINNITVGFADVIDGKVTYEYGVPDDFKNVNYDIVMQYINNRKIADLEGYESSAILSIEKQNTKVLLNNMTGFAGSSIKLSSLFTKEITGSIFVDGHAVFKIDGRTVTNVLDVKNGIVDYEYTIPENFVGTHSLSVVYSGNGHLYSANEVATLTVY